ncbi:MAG: ornithine carbamoyltransferase, partial [Alphaproteobacteria bacterium]
MTRHFLDLKDVSAEDLRTILDGAKSIKAARLAGSEKRPLTGKTLAMIFEKPSTRTRVSFECAIKQLGGDAIVLNASDMQIGRGESVFDTAKVLS